MNQSTLLKGIIDLASKVNSLEERLNALQPSTNAARSAPEWVDKSMLSSALNDMDTNVKAVDTATRSLASDLRHGIAQVKDEVAKERAAAENAMLLKLEHFVAKCVKERLELAIQGVKQNVDDRVKEKIEEALNDLKTHVASQVERAVASVPQAQPSIPAPTQAAPPPPIVPAPITDATIDSAFDALDIESFTKPPSNTDTSDVFGSDTGDIMIKKRGFKKVAKP